MVSKLGFTFVELSLIGISLVAIVAAIMLTLLRSLLEEVEDMYEEDDTYEEHGENADE
jgi:Tfp pilus assembly protein FimT